MTLQARWLKFAARIDALAPRERLLALAATLAVLVFIAWMAVLGPALKKQDALHRQIAQQRDTIAGMEAEAAHKIAAGRADPDAPLRDRLGAVRQESVRMTEELRAMQKGLVAPERIAPLLETILRSNGRLKLLSLKTLPVASLSEMAAREASLDKPAEAPKDATAAPKTVARAPDLLFAHGVELSVRGSYLDMVDYMTTLEALPTQLFWGRAQLDVEQYPNVRLTLTLYTLSLDQKWMKL